MSKETGGPAFPTSDWDENDMAYKMHGMTLRDYFAAQAMNKIIGSGPWTSEEVSTAAYRLADAMLEARK